MSKSKKQSKKEIDTLSTKIAVFRGRKVRKTIHNNEWWFSVIDIIAVLTDSVNPNDYWYKMKIRVKSEDRVELSTFCRQLRLIARMARNTLLIALIPKVFLE